MSYATLECDTLRRMKTCACGCGTELEPRTRPSEIRVRGLWPSFIKGHHIQRGPLKAGYVKRQRLALTGRALTPEQRQKIAEGMRDPEARARHIAAVRARSADPEWRRRHSEQLKGRALSQEHRDAISQGLTGKTYGELHHAKRAEVRAKIGAGNKGKRRTDEQREAMSRRSIGNKSRLGQTQSEAERAKKGVASSRHWSDPEARAKARATFLEMWKDPNYTSAVFLGRAVRPNKSELKLKRMLDRLFPGEYRYVGDGQLVVGGKVPDFVNINSEKNTKKLIELYGDYWHAGQDPAVRAAHFAPFGYSTLVVWERELADPTLLAKLVEFHEAHP